MTGFPCARHTWVVEARTPKTAGALHEVHATFWRCLYCGTFQETHYQPPTLTTVPSP